MPEPLYFPTLEHQYAPEFKASRAYTQGAIVIVKDALPATTYRVFKCIQEAPANTVTEANYAQYFREYMPKQLPNPSRPYKTGIKANTIIYTSDSGAEQRRERSAAKTTFELTWNALLIDQYQTIRDFYMYVLNSKPFIWVCPIEKTQTLVRISNEIFQGENKGHGPKGPIYALQLSLVQVWA